MNRAIKEIKQITKQLDDFFYYSLEHLRPEDRLKVSAIISDLKKLATDIERQEDLYFDGAPARYYGSEL
jgi:hypothetical protein